MVNKIKGSGCDVVLSNVVGDSGGAVYREYKNQWGRPTTNCRFAPLSLPEIEDRGDPGPEYAVGSFTSFPYFQARIDTDRNKKAFGRAATAPSSKGIQRR